MYKVGIIILINCLCYHAGLAQAKGLSSLDSLVLENGTTLHMGDTLELGKVSGKNDKFQHVYRPAGGFFYMPKMRVDKEFEGEDAIISRFTQEYVSRGKTKMVAIIYNKGLGYKNVDIHPAFKSGEIAAVRKKASQQEEEER